MSSGGQWQQQQQHQQHEEEWQHHQQPYEGYLNTMSSMSPLYQPQPQQHQQQQQQHQHQHQDQHQHQISQPRILEKQPQLSPFDQQHQQHQHFTYPAVNRNQLYPQQHSFASTSSPSSSPLSARTQISIHAQDHAMPFDITNGDADHSQGDFYGDDTILAGMSIHLAAPTENPSASSSANRSTDQSSQYNQEQSIYNWPQSQSSNSLHSTGSYGVYDPADSMSGQAVEQQQQQQQQQQRSFTSDSTHNFAAEPYQQHEGARVQIHRPNHHEEQSYHRSSTSWIATKATTPDVFPGFDQDQQSLDRSPSWQQMLSPQQHSAYLYNAHQPQSYPQDGLELTAAANPNQNPLITGVRQNLSSGQLQRINTRQLPMYDTPLEATRSSSKISGLSLASSSNHSSAAYSIHRSNSQNEILSEPSEGSYFGQYSQGSSSSTNNATWISPSPSESESSSRIQHNAHPLQRKISTPQRLQQQLREQNATSSRNALSSPGGMGHSNLSPATSMTEFDYTDHRLSAALANNARISSSASDTFSLSQRGNTTPTILEEEQQQQQQQFSDHRSPISPSPSLSTSLRRSPLGRGSFAEQGSHLVIRRHRPFLHQPSIFQQYSPYNTTNELRHDLPDCSSFIDEVMSAYLTTPSRLGLGEKVVLIMTSKVAQKSYGQEKRFLCPPPMVILVGTSWWNAQSGGGGPDSTPTVLTPPRLTIAMSEQNDMQEATLEWASVSGKLIDVGNSSSDMAISGRSIGKQLYINDADDKKRHCEALVHITLPSLSSHNRRSLGTFASKPIKVISKPSKKRQSNRTSDLSVIHGSTISLFHRLRSQTVSTRYLCVSGAPTWFKGSDGHPFLNTNENTHIPNQSEPSSCFVAKMSSWDTFIIYLVDPHIQASAATSNKVAFQPHYPPPPINVLPRMANGQGQPICYNQAVVLQCLNTAVVSPVMIIRRVDRQTTVVGGGQSSFTSSPSGRLDPTVESLGDPVSQLHKIAFEILEDSNAPVPLAEYRESGAPPGQSGHFLGCLNEDVGLRKPLAARQWVAPSFSNPPTPTTPVTPLHLSVSASASSKGGSDAMDTPPSSMNEAINAANIAAAQTRYAMRQQRDGSASGNISPTTSIHVPSSSRSQYSSTGHSPLASGISSGGEEESGQMKRPRRVSSSVVIQKDRMTIAAKSRRRGQSLTVGMHNQFQGQQPSQLSALQHHQLQLAAMQTTFPMTAVSSTTSSNESKSQSRRTSSIALSLSNSELSSSWGVPAGAMWTVDVHDSDIWTIVGTDIARHTFYIPPNLVGGIKPSIDVADQGIAHLINVPAPATPITPIPIVHHCIGPNSSSSSSATSSTSSSKSNKNKMTYVTLSGEYLTDDLFVYFGDWKCIRVTKENDSTIYCEPPPPFEEFGLPRGKVPITLVRRDGVVFPTSHTYQC